ncbi:hypothetical protein EUTSA_v10026708mg [Eutrema salsugineum]|uniref:Uncharacterized protein n=1 Tax=Eutrema salsugineum TaxID=72664 RepID=V4MSM9_EUTSA|nr:hypothetical protein EUTSA_v10026708mg [Eutrema salsugineum]
MHLLLSSLLPTLKTPPKQKRKILNQRSSFLSLFLFSLSFSQICVNKFMSGNHGRGSLSLFYSKDERLTTSMMKLPRGWW